MVELEVWVRSAEGLQRQRCGGPPLVAAVAWAEMKRGHFAAAHSWRSFPRCTSGAPFQSGDTSVIWEETLVVDLDPALLTTPPPPWSLKLQIFYPRTNLLSIRRVIAYASIPASTILDMCRPSSSSSSSKSSSVPVITTFPLLSAFFSRPRGFLRLSFRLRSSAGVVSTEESSSSINRSTNLSSESAPSIAVAHPSLTRPLAWSAGSFSEVLRLAKNSRNPENLPDHEGGDASNPGVSPLYPAHHLAYSRAMEKWTPKPKD